MSPQQARDQLRRIAQETIDPYRAEYAVDNAKGVFEVRMMTRLNNDLYAVMKWQNVALRYGDWDQWIRQAIYATLTGCNCQGRNESIPMRIRQQIEEKIVETFAQLDEPYDE